MFRKRSVEKEQLDFEKSSTECFVAEVWDKYLSEEAEKVSSAVSLRMEDFAELFLAEMSDENVVVNLMNPDDRIMVLKFDWKDVIMAILCENNGWREKFSYFIDMRAYFGDHVAWEMKFANTILDVVKRLGKELKPDLVHGYFGFTFTKAEVATIRTKYSSETRDIVRHFTNLMTSHYYSREMREERLDYIARAYTKMRALNKKVKQEYYMKYYGYIPDIIF